MTTAQTHDTLIVIPETLADSTNITFIVNNKLDRLLREQEQTKDAINRLDKTINDPETGLIVRINSKCDVGKMTDMDKRVTKVEDGLGVIKRIAWGAVMSGLGAIAVAVVQIISIR